MIFGPNDKKLRVAIAQSATAAATVSATWDTAEFDFCVVDTDLGTAATNPSVFTLSEGEATNSFTTIAAFVGDTAWTVPAADTSNDQTIRFNVDLRPRKRYLKIAVSPGATQFLSIGALLSRADETPTTIAQLGLTANVNG